MNKILQPVRFFTLLFFLLTYVVIMSVVWMFVRGHWNRVRWSHIILTRYARVSLFLLNIKVNYVGLNHLGGVGHGALFVGNHLSYLDILVIHARIPVCFVTSREIRETPVLGQVCALAGCLFVERRNKHAIHNEVSELSDGLSRGLNVAIFPEATSGNGEQLLKFRRPLYLSALGAQKPIVPLCLNYRRVGGVPISLNNRDHVFWYGDMDFSPHLWAVAGSGGINVDLHILPPIFPGRGDDATSLTDRSFAAIEEVFLPVPSTYPSAQEIGRR